MPLDFSIFDEDEQEESSLDFSVFDEPSKDFDSAVQDEGFTAPDYGLTDVRGLLSEPERQQRERFISSIPSHVKQSAKESFGGLTRSLGETDVVGGALSGLETLFPSLQYARKAAGKLGIERPKIKPLGADYLTEKGTETAEEAGKAKEKLIQDVEKYGPISGAQQTTLGAAESLGLAIPGMAVAPWAGAGPLLGMFGLSEYGRSYQQAREAGKDAEESNDYAMRNAGIEVGTELIPAVKMFAKGTPGFQRLIDVLGSELGGESVATLGQNLNEYLSKVGPEMTVPEFLTKLWEDEVQTWKTTAVTAGAQTALGHQVANMIDASSGVLEQQSQELETKPDRTVDDIIASNELKESAQGLQYVKDTVDSVISEPEVAKQEILSRATNKRAAGMTLTAQEEAELANREFDLRQAVPQEIGPQYTYDKVAEGKQAEQRATQEAEDVARSDPIYSQVNEIKKRGGINLSALSKDYDVRTKRQILKKFPGIFSKQGTLQPDEVASEFGYDTQDDFIQALYNAGSVKQQASKIAQQTQDREKSVGEEYDRIVKQGFEFTAPQEVVVADLNKGDKVIVDNNGVPDVVEHKGTDKDGNVILQDGKTIKVDEFDKLEIQGKKPAPKDEDSNAGKSQVKRVETTDEQAARSEVSPASKQPWEMTRKEWRREKDNRRGNGAYSTLRGPSSAQARNDAINEMFYGVEPRFDEELGEYVQPTHKDVIDKAIKEGKFVPAAVLKEYPDLVPAEQIQDIPKPQFRNPKTPVSESGIKQQSSKKAEEKQDVATGGKESAPRKSSKSNIPKPKSPAESGESIAPKGKVKKSTATLPPSQQAEVKSELTSKLGRIAVKSLERSGFLNIVTLQQAENILAGITGAEIKRGESGTIEGFTVGNKSYLVNGNIAKGKASEVFTHELGSHLILEGAFQGKKWNDIVSTFKRIEKTDSATGKAIQAARKRIPANTKPEHVDSELIAYYLGSQANQKQSLYRRVMSYIKNFLVNLGVPARILKPQDLSVIAESAIKRLARQAETAQAVTNEGDLQTVLASMAEQLGVSREQLQKEFDETRAKYEGEIGTAPNGKPSNLSDHLWVLTRTPRFLAWFGDYINDPANASKVVDENGEPLVVYHGTNKEFSEFDPSYRGTNYKDEASKAGFFFATNEDGARFYGDNVLPVYLSIPKLFEITEEVQTEYVNEWLEELRESDKKEYDFQVSTKEYQNSGAINKGVELAIVDAQEKGYDGVKIIDEEYGDDIYVAFSPNQIKSIFNSGEFGETGDIRYSNGKPIQKVTQAMLNSVPFRKWFDKSVMRDKSGTPIPVYHGTANNKFLTEDGSWIFDSEKGKGSHHSPLAGLGNFFALDRTEAAGYTGGTGNVRPFYVSLQNPLVTDSWQLNHIATKEEAKAFAKRMELRGHDGIYFRDQGHVVMFDGGNIKSAEMNTGEFDRGNKDLRFAIAAEGDGAPFTSEGFDMPTESSALDTFKFYIVDKYAPLLKIQRAIGKVSEGANAFRKQVLQIGRTESRVREFKEDIVDPILQKLSDNDILLQKDYEGEGHEFNQTLDQYLYARHAKEANARLRLTNAKRFIEDLIVAMDNDRSAQKNLEDKLKQVDEQFKGKDLSKVRKEAYYELLEAQIPIVLKSNNLEDVQRVVDRWNDFKSRPSGMTDKQASELLKQYAEDKNTDVYKELANDVYAMNKKRIQMLLNADLISKEEATAWEKAYKYYVPLKREGFSDKLPARGSGIQLPAKESKARGGSTRRAVDLFANAVANYETTIKKSEKKRVAESLYKLVKENPNPDFWRIKKADMEAYYDGDGNIRMRPTQQVKENEVKVRINGETYLIWFNPDNAHGARLAEVLRGGDSNHGAIVGGLMKFNRVLAFLNTSGSPEFIVSNFLRDIQTAAVNLTDTQASKLRGQVMRDVFRSMSGIKDALQGEGKSEWGKWFKRFEKAGGRTGWIDNYSGIKDRAKALEKDIKLMSSSKKHVAKRAFKRTMDFIDDYNTIVENAIRLSTFKNLVEAGVSEDKAAETAKELTTNFNRKGAGGEILNSLYLFANAGVQGSARIIKALGNKKVRRMVGGIVVTAALADVASRAIGGDDDDNGIPDYDEVPDYIKERNMVFMVPGLKQPVKIPLPWGYNVFWNIGTEIGRMTGEKGYSVQEGAARLTSTALNAFNPMQAATLLQTLSPTVTDPVAQIAENKNWAGQPLMPERFPGDTSPDASLYWKSSRPTSQYIAKSINELFGGDAVKSAGAMDFSPESIDVWIDTFTGSAGRVVSDIFNTPYKAIMGEDVETKEIPMLRRVYGGLSKSGNQSRYFDNINELKTLEKQLEYYAGDRKKIRELKSENRNKIRLISVADKYEKKLRKLRRMRKKLEAAGNTSRLKRINERIDNMYVRFNKIYYTRT